MALFFYSQQNLSPECDIHAISPLPPLHLCTTLPPRKAGIMFLIFKDSIFIFIYNKKRRKKYKKFTLQ